MSYGPSPWTRATHGSTLLVHDIAYAHLWKPNTGRCLCHIGDDELERATMRIRERLQRQGENLAGLVSEITEPKPTHSAMSEVMASVAPLVKPWKLVWRSVIRAVISENREKREKRLQNNYGRDTGAINGEVSGHTAHTRADTSPAPRYRQPTTASPLTLPSVNTLMSTMLGVLPSPLVSSPAPSSSVDIEIELLAREMASPSTKSSSLHRWGRATMDRIRSSPEMMVA